MSEKKLLNEEELENVNGGIYDEDPLAFFNYYDTYNIKVSPEELIVGRDYLFCKGNTKWYFGTFQGINTSKIENDNGMIVKVKDAYKSFDGFAWDFDTVNIRFQYNYEIFSNC